MTKGAGDDYEQLLALHHAMQLRRSLRDGGPSLPTPRRPTGYPERTTDQELMTESLESVGSAADEVIRTFYAQLFLGRPYLRSMFPGSLRADSDRLFSALIGMIEALDDLDGFVRSLEQLGRDHRKYGVRPAHYDAVREALVGALREHAGPAWRAEQEAAWRRAYDFAAAVMQAAEAGTTDPPYWHATVVSHERRHDTIAVLRVKTDVPYGYRPGQYATVEVPELPQLWRPYSMATPPRDDGVLEFHVRAVELGRVSTALVHRTSSGDPLRLGPPRGEAVLDGSDTRPLLCVAGGTGLSACKAVTEHVLETQPGRPVQLAFGTRTAAELYDGPELVDLADRYPALGLVPAVSDDPAFDGPHGTLPDLVADSGPWTGHEVYVCGPPAMVDAMDHVLARLGVDPDSVHHDPVPR